MTRAGAGLIVAAALALAGCRATDPKPDDKKPADAGAARPKGKDAPATKGPAWYDDVTRLPGAGTSIPKAGAPTNPKDPNFDPRTAAGDALGGRVLGPDGKPARNVAVNIELLAASDGPGVPIGISTNNDGYFFAAGLKPGRSYEVTASAAPPDGKPLSASTQTRVPNVVLTLVLRDDLPPPVGGFPPTPKPAELAPPSPTRPRPSDGAWSPPGGPTTGRPPATIGGTPPAPSGGALPPVSDDLIPSPAPKPARPENVADDPKNPFRPPVANIPGPGGPPLPKLPPPFNPTGGGRSSLDTGARGAGKLALLDTAERPWSSADAVPPGSLLLVEFVTSTCGPCKQVIPVMKDVQARYGASGLQVAAVLCDEVPQKERASAAAKYGSDHTLNYAVYVEPGATGSVRDRFDVQSYPTAVLLTAGGQVLWRGHPGKRAELESAIKQGLGK